MVVQQAHWTKMTSSILIQRAKSLPYESVPHDVVGPPSLAQQGGVPSLFYGSLASTVHIEKCQEVFSYEQLIRSIRKSTISGRTYSEHIVCSLTTNKVG